MSSEINPAAHKHEWFLFGESDVGMGMVLVKYRCKCGASTFYPFTLKDGGGGEDASTATHASVKKTQLTLTVTTRCVGLVGWKRDYKIICLCGSTRFSEQMLIKQWELAKQGHVVLTWNVLPNSYINEHGGFLDHCADVEGVREIVDRGHKRKIDLCDEVLVLNIGGYIGDSTRSEIQYAVDHGKVVRYLEEVA